MQNLKIRVNSEAEAEEVKRLAVKAGYKLDALFGKKWSAEFCYLLLCEDMSAGFANEIMAEGDKPLSIGELRDLVVLKRDDVSDATHKDQDNWSWYISSNGDGYVWQCGNSQQIKQWDKASLNFVDLKSIEKNMKEYLIPSRDYEYILTDSRDGLEPHAKDWIEIPDGANIAVLSLNGFIVFYKDDNSNEFYATETGVDFSFKWELDGNGVGNREIIWQREQDEPFLTPECTLNDQYAEVEEVRQVEIHGTVKAKPDFNFGAAQSTKDNVNHPSHYTQGKVECIDALESATIGKSGIEAVCVANVIKYLWRYEEKNGLEDVKKAQFYLNRLVATLENNNG